MENRKNENSMNLAGDIRKEMEEVQKMQARDYEEKSVN